VQAVEASRGQVIHGLLDGFLQRPEDPGVPDLGSWHIYVLAASEGLVNALGDGPATPAWHTGNVPLLKAFASPDIPRGMLVFLHTRCYRLSG